ncbi:hypothetical protein [Streptomyces xantholiticus]|uniref:hypothetical protein n=1 Tax=Streptomyces xantholiticus TaxID=68285 RepID=UPI0016743F4A|nr:hypothetical protein [Streptomyces xantholiticus]GGW27099.1 hypothetical protein GCM10010381_09140 [Streptomyces xantholiticus]
MRRRSAAVLAGLATLLLGGCGVPETDVIEAGGPATVQVFPEASSGLVLFLRSPDGELMPVIRFLEGELEEPDSPGAGTPTTVAALFAGPLPNERRAGLTDGLPELPGRTAVRAVPYREGGVEVTLPIAVGDLDDLAVRQLVCTIAFTEDDEGLTPVRLRGTDTALEPAVCDEDIDLGRLPRPTTAPAASSPSGSQGGQGGRRGSADQAAQDDQAPSGP